MHKALEQATILKIKVHSIDIAFRTVVRMNLDTNPFNNIIPLEEISHFQKSHKPIKSILSTHKYGSPITHLNSKKVSYLPHSQNQTIQNEGESAKSSTNDLSGHDPNEESITTDPGERNILPGPSRSSTKSKNSSPNEQNYFHHSDSDSDEFLYSRKYNLGHSPTTSKKGEVEDDSDFGSESESDTEFRRDFAHLPSGRDPFNPNANNVGRLTNGVSDENLFSIPNIQVTRDDVLFAFIVFVIHLGEFVTDFVLTVWHYQNGQQWACAFTLLFMAVGGIGMLHQFGMLQPDQLDRLFRKGKRMRILVNCFPPLATAFVSLEATISAWRARGDQMQSQQHFKINELSRCLSRSQSFLQAAPQAAVQFVILMENFHETSWDKVFFTLINIAISLAVMTNANLPSKTDEALDPNTSPSKASYLPMTRIFVGTRMFSSLGSRCMAISYLLVGCRCLLDPDPTGSSSSFTSTLSGITMLLFPRLVFTFTDYLASRRVTERNLEHYRDQPELGISSSHPIANVPLIDTFVGYLATTFFPVGDPLWLFWYLWCEAGIFMIFGNVAGLTHHCLDDRVNGIYTSVFVITFVIVPFVIPFTKAAIQRRKIQKFRRILNVVEDNDSSGGGSVDVGESEYQGVNDNQQTFKNSVNCSTNTSREKVDAVVTC